MMERDSRHSGGPPIPGEPQIEAYLDRVLQPLGARVPASERRELRLEMRTHLLAAIDAYRELGCSPEEAVGAALRRFGAPRRLGREWSRAASRSALLAGWPAVLSAIVLAFSALGASAALVIPPSLSAYPCLEAWLAGPVIPLLGGFLLGRADGGRGVRTLVRLGLLSAGGLLISTLLPGMPPHYAWDVGAMRMIVWAIAACDACGLGMLATARSRRGRSREITR